MNELLGGFRVSDGSDCRSGEGHDVADCSSPEVPDRVIEEAHGYGAAASRNQQDHLHGCEAEDVERRWKSGGIMSPSEAAVAAAAPVIAGWAEARGAAQERARWTARIEKRAKNEIAEADRLSAEATEITLNGGDFHRCDRLRERESEASRRASLLRSLLSEEEEA